MNTIEYQEEVKELSLYKETMPGGIPLPKFSVYKPKDIMYTVLGLTGEAGEVANQVKKYVRDDHFVWTPERVMKVKDEIGDVLWYATALCNEMGFELSDVMQCNIDKLHSRQKNGTIKGDKRDD